MTEETETGKKHGFKLIQMIYVIIVLVAVIVAVFMIMSALSGNSKITQVGNGWNAVTASQPFTVGNSLYVTFIGIEGCKFCAAERYAVFAALGNFGNWTFNGKPVTLSTLNISNLSSEPQPYTLFYQANEGGWTINFLAKNLVYSSKLVAFSSVETLNNYNNPLQTPNAIQTAYINKYDAVGSVPFTVIGGNFFEIGAGSSLVPGGIPITLSNGGMTPTEMISGYNTNGSAVNLAITTEANYITAIICHDISNSAATCSIPVVNSIEKTLN